MAHCFGSIEDSVLEGCLTLTGDIFQVYGECTLIFPLIVAETFARHHFKLPVENVDKEKD